MLISISGESQNNKISIESQYEYGSTFFFYIQLPNNENTEILLDIFPENTEEYIKKYMDKEFFQYINTFNKQNQDIDLQSAFLKTILVVEDEETNIMVMQMYLKDVKANKVYKRNGKEGLDFYISSVRNGHKIDLILMDLNMPIMNGNQATREIRKFENQCKIQPSKIIVLTANILTMGEKEAKENGFDSFEIKPISKAKLMKVLKANL